MSTCYLWIWWHGKSRRWSSRKVVEKIKQIKERIDNARVKGKSIWPPTSHVSFYININDALEIISGHRMLNISIIQLWCMYDFSLYSIFKMWDHIFIQFDILHCISSSIYIISFVNYRFHGNDIGPLMNVRMWAWIYFLL